MSMKTEQRSQISLEDSEQKMGYLLHSQGPPACSRLTPKPFTILGVTLPGLSASGSSYTVTLSQSSTSSGCCERGHQNKTSSFIRHTLQPYSPSSYQLIPPVPDISLQLFQTLPPVSLFL